MAEPAVPERVRVAALVWLQETTLGGTAPLTREQLANDFRVDGERFPLIDRGRGIRKPRGWPAALSITTAAPTSGGARPYDDAEGPDGLQRYKLRRDVHGHAENAGLRAAMHAQLPLIWFYGVAPSVFNAIFPIWIVGEEPEHDQFVLALTELQREITSTSTVEHALRATSSPTPSGGCTSRSSPARSWSPTRHAARCVGSATASSSTPRTSCPTRTRAASRWCPTGWPSARSTTRRTTATSRPDLVVEIHHRLLDEVDGPMLRHGLQGRHGQTLLKVPTRRAQAPDPDRLAERYADFRSA